MRVCDKHPDRPARDTVVIVNDDSRMDVCSECKTELLLLMHAPDAPIKKRGKPAKDLAQAN